VATFKKKPISEQAVAAAEANAAMAPIVDDPRMPTVQAAPEVSADKPAVTKQTVTTAANLGSSQEMKAAVGQIVHAPLARVKSNPLNPRAVYTNTAIDEMAVSLSTNGQRVAALGYMEEDGHVVLIEGETRLRGARAAGLETLRVELRPKPGSDRALYEMARAANVERRDQTPLDDAIRWKELLAKKIYPTQSALAKALEVGEDHVSRTLSLASLSQKTIIAAAEFPDLMNLKMLNALREFFEQQGEGEAIELIHEAAKSGLGYRDVVARRKSAAKGPVRRPRSIREPLTFASAKGEIKTFEEDGRLELVLKGLAVDEASRLVERIKKLLSEPSA
jgi:ParB family chromosome partitioning protein